MTRPSYAVNVEPGTGLIVKPSRAESRPGEVDFMRVRWMADIPGVTAWLRSLGLQFIVHTDASANDAGDLPALTLYLRREVHTVMFGDVLVLPDDDAGYARPGWYSNRMVVVPREEFDKRYAPAD